MTDPLKKLSLAEIDRRLRALNSIHPGQRSRRAFRERTRLADERRRRQRKGA